MNTPLKVLILTDHSGHSSENSVYALARGMVRHPRCAYVHVASRGLPENAPFFQCHPDAALYASPVDPDFDYSSDGSMVRKNLKTVDPTCYDLIFMRLPRPISDDQLRWIEVVFKDAVIVNKPSGIIETSSKAFLLKFPDCCPPVKLCKSIDDIVTFAQRFPIVLKPLYEYGGKGILKINGEKLDDGTTEYDTTQYLTSIKDAIEQEGYLAMKFLKNVRQGDKRILVVDGAILAASLRLPAEDSWLCNVAQGGYAVPAEPSEEEIRIVDIVAPRLKKEGVLICGLDTLVDDSGKRVLSEINTLSVGGFPQAEVQTGRPIIEETVERIFRHAYNSRK